MGGYILAAMAGAVVGVWVTCLLVAGQDRRPRNDDVIERVSDDSRVNLSQLAEIRRARAAMRREGVGGTW
jgi:hypothetical protein